MLSFAVCQGQLVVAKLYLHKATFLLGRPFILAKSDTLIRMQIITGISLLTYLPDNVAESEVSKSWEQGRSILGGLIPIWHKLCGLPLYEAPLLMT